MAWTGQWAAVVYRVVPACLCQPFAGAGLYGSTLGLAVAGHCCRQCGVGGGMRAGDVERSGGDAAGGGVSWLAGTGGAGACGVGVCGHPGVVRHAAGVGYSGLKEGWTMTNVAYVA